MLLAQVVGEPANVIRAGRSALLNPSTAVYQSVGVRVRALLLGLGAYRTTPIHIDHQSTTSAKMNGLRQMQRLFGHDISRRSWRTLPRRKFASYDSKHPRLSFDVIAGGEVIADSQVSDVDDKVSLNATLSVP